MHDGWISNFHTSLFFGYSECSFPRGSEFVLASARFQISGSCWMEMEYKCMHTSNGSSIRNSGFLFTPHYTIKQKTLIQNDQNSLKITFLSINLLWYFSFWFWVLIWKVKTWFSDTYLLDTSLMHTPMIKDTTCLSSLDKIQLMWVHSK